MATNIFGKPGSTAAPAATTPPPQQGDQAQPQPGLTGQAPGNADSVKLAESSPTGQPAFGKSGGQDENNPLTEPAQVESAQAGAVQQSAAAQVASGNPVAGEASQPDENGDEPQVEFTSHPISRFRMGKYQFERGVLTLGAKEAAEFEEFLKTMPKSDQNLVKRLGDRAAADAIAARFRESRMKAGVDTSEPKPGEPRA